MRLCHPVKKKTENSNLHGFEVHRPSSKGNKLLLQVIKAIINQYTNVCTHDCIHDCIHVYTLDLCTRDFVHICVEWSWYQSADMCTHDCI